MSAPDTNIETQTKRHKASLIGIGIALFWAVLAIGAFIVWDGVPSDEQAAATLEVDADE
jgi:hypothetical protein